MDDLFLFLAGLAVTLVVGAAVTLLVWGASQERRERERIALESEDELPSSPSHVTLRLQSGR